MSGLSPDQVTAAHIHRGPIGTNGPIIHNLSLVGFTQISGQITLSDADVADLKAGNLYVNAHSVANPGGFARGQLLVTPGDSLAASARAAVDAYNSQNISRLVQFFTDAGFKDEFGGATKAEALAHPDQIFQGPVNFRSVTNAIVNGTNATSNFEIGLGIPGATTQVVQREFLTWVLDAGLWKVSASRPDPAPIAGGANTLNVNLRDFAFDFSAAAAAAGPSAFHFTNTGTQEHEAVFVKLNSSRSLADIANELLQGGPDAPPPADVAFFDADEAGPGESFDFVLTSALPAGRYAFFCFFPDKTTGQPHVALGMRAEFTVGAGGGSGILPPNTGDAGLAARRPDHATFTYAGLALLAIAGLGAGGLTLARRRA
jgi:plastocyanin